MADSISVLHLCLRPLEEDDTGLYQAISAGLQRAPLKVITACLEPAQDASKPLQTHCLNIDHKQLKGLRLRAILKLIPFFKQHAFEVVVTHRFKPCYITAIISLFIPIRKKIAVFHGASAFGRLYQRLFARLFMRSFTLVAVSQAVKDYLLAQHAGFRAEQIIVIPNAIDVPHITATQLSKQAARAELGLPQDAFVFGHVARQVAGKGQIYLIDAFARCVAPKAHLLLIGTGPEQTVLQQRVNELQLNHRVHFAGKIPMASRYMTAFDAFVLPSLDEGFGMVLLEAMAARLPLVATNVGGIPEVVGALTTLCPPRDVHALQQHMQCLYRLYENDPEHLAAMGEEAYQRVCQQFSIEHYQTAFWQLCQMQQLPITEPVCS